MADQRGAVATLVSRHALALLALGAAALFLPGIAARDLWAPDEPRCAEVAREMLRSGDWIVPRDNGRIYPDKPPLLFWLIALASLPVGQVTAASARLPVAAGAIGTVLLTGALGRRWFGPRRGLAAGVILATSIRGFVSAQWAQTDGVLVFFTTLAVLGIARILDRPRATAADLAQLYGGVAGAILTKGPVGLVLPALVAAGWSAANPAAGLLRRLRPGWLAASIAPGLAWGWAAQRSSAGGYSLAAALRQHVVERFAFGLHHPRDPLYFLWVFPLEFLPWTLFLGAWAVFPGRGEAGTRPGRRRALVWIAVPLLLLTLSAEKRGVYLLPLYPAAALLVAGSWPAGDWPHCGERARARALAPLVALLALTLAALALPWLAAQRLGAGAGGLAAATGAAAAAAAWAMRSALRDRPARALAGAAACAAALLLGGSLALAPALNPHKSARFFCERVSRRLDPRDRLAQFQPYRSAFVFYTGRLVDVVEDAAGLERFLAPGRAYCILDRDRYRELPAALRNRYPPLEEAEVGHRSMLLIGAASTTAGPPPPRAPGS